MSEAFEEWCKRLEGWYDTPGVMVFGIVLE